MTINLHLPSHSETLRPKITVIGVGGAGGNAVNNMIAANLEGVDFVMANTDSQALESALTDRTIQLGVSVTRGLGAGANPQIGQSAAEEALDEIAEYVGGSNMVFITAGMGGGTGTGAAPVIAQLAREQGMLTVGVVTKPFHFEGAHRMRLAERGIEELQQYVDTLIVIPNQNLFRIANERTTFAEAFRMADEVLHSGVRGVTDLMVKPGLVNLDFADIRAVMSEMGKAMMGTGEAEGEKRAVGAAESAISNPLLDDVSLKGARAVLINITGGPDMTLFEVDEAANRIRDEVDPNANIIFGSTFSDSMEGRMRVSVVATGIESPAAVQEPVEEKHRHQYPSPVKQQPAPVSKPTAAAVASAPKVTSPSHINIQPRHETKRDRTAAEIVRQAAATVDVARRGGYPPQPGQRLEYSEPERANAHVPAPPPALAQASLAQAAQPQEHEMQEQLSIDESLLDTSDDRRAYRLGEVKERMDDAPAGPLFVAPRPEQPSQRTAMRSAPESEEYDDDTEEESAAMGFFKKIAGGAGKAFAHKERPEAPQREPVSQSRSRAAVKESAAPEFAEDEEYLDIPAFLRRQAN